MENKRSEPTGPGKQGACGKENKLSTIASSYTVQFLLTLQKAEY